MNRSNNINYSKALLLTCLSIFFLCFSNAAKANCKTKSNFELYKVTETVSQPSDSSLFNPTIRVKRSEHISWIECSESVTLKASECKSVFAGLYRYCARYTEPESHGNNYACDYTTTQSVDSETNEITTTETVNCGDDYDDDCPGCRCNCSQRVCAYYDLPGGGDLSEDWFEPEYGSVGMYNSTSDDDYRYCCITPPLTYYYQPYHKNVDNPCCGGASCGGWGYDPCGEPWLTSDGSKINGSADHVGCVDIPLGPYPPPLCDPIQGMTPGVSSFNICTNSPDYELDPQSNSDTYDEALQTPIACNDPTNPSECTSVCELSTQTGDGNPASDARYSTFERPLIRIYFKNSLDLCPENYTIPSPTPVNDTCVQFLNPTWSSEYIWRDQKNLIPLCDANGVGDNCLSFPSNHSTRTGPSGDSDSLGSSYKFFKTYYNVFNSDVISSTQDAPYADYSYGDEYSTPTVSLAGIYDTYYEDMTDECDPGSMDSLFTRKIVDYTSMTRNFQSYLNIDKDDDDSDGMTLYVEEIIDGQANVVATLDRPKMFPPTVSSCLLNGECQYPSSTKPYEQPRISFNVGREFIDVDGSKVMPQSAIIGIDLPDSGPPTPFCILDNYHSNETTKTDDNIDPCTVYKAKIFSAILTDDDNFQINSDSDGTVTPYGSSETYTGGLQYVDNIYCRGATKICLTGLTSNKQVIARNIPIAGEDDIDKYPISESLSDRVIPPAPDPNVGETYPLSDEILYDPSIHRDTAEYTQSTSNTYYGYMINNENDPSDPTNGTYVSQAYCTSGSYESASNILCTTTLSDSEIPNIDSETPSDKITCTCSNKTGEVIDDCSTSSDPNCEPTYSDDGKYDCTNDQCQFVWKETSSNVTEEFVGYKYTDYSVNPSVTHYYPKEDYGERPLSYMELNQCVDAAKPFCDAITNETEGSLTAEANGNANWPQTDVNVKTSYTSCVEGTQPLQDRSVDPPVDIFPTRYCRYFDTGNSLSNNCPEYTISFDYVENPCAKASLPFWWPSEFLKGKGSLQGAIFNQFNIAPPYEDIFIPKSGNYNPYDVQSINLEDSSTWVEDWYTTSAYHSCKNYQSSRTTSNTKRNVTDGDQEMLFLTEREWRLLWTTYDLTWLLVDDASNNGCYVYDLGNNVNATFPSSMAVGMKICKYNNKVSFSLVDTKYNTRKDYKNIAYIMQSNIIAYDAYTTQNVVDNVSNEGGFVPKTTITDNDLPNKKSKYHNYINHGIVVDKNGFDPFETDEVVPGPPPSDFVKIEDAEEIGTSFYFAGVYNWKTSYKDSWSNTKHRDYAKYSFASPYSCGEGDDHSYTDGRYDAQKSTNNYPTCALSQYRGAINYSYPDSSSTRENISVYLPGPTDIDPLNLTSQQGESANQGGSYSYISRQYWNSCYGGNNMDGSWPYQDGCIQEITVGKDLPGGISGYTYGNSARNANMFLWRSDKSYDVCND